MIIVIIIASHFVQIGEYETIACDDKDNVEIQDYENKERVREKK